MFRYPGRPSKAGWPKDVWVLGTSFVDRAPVGVGASSAPNSAAEAKSADMADADHDHGKTGKPNAVANLLEWVHSENAKERVEALSRLTADKGADPAVLRVVFEQALFDEDAEVRTHAVYGLAKDGAEDTAGLWHTALYDRDASVRLMAVDSLGEGVEDLALLREALADTDETVKALAALKLDTVENPQPEPR